MSFQYFWGLVNFCLKNVFVCSLWYVVDLAIEIVYKYDNNMTINNNISTINYIRIRYACTIWVRNNNDMTKKLDKKLKVNSFDQLNNVVSG